MYVLVGTGGHAKVVFYGMRGHLTAKKSIVVRDDHTDKRKDFFMGLPVSTPALVKSMKNTNVHVAIGDNRTRERILEVAVATGATAFTVIDPESHVSDTARIGLGVFVACGAVVAADAYISCGVIINHNSVVDHDCCVDSFSHMAPGVILGGNVTIGKRVLVGAGAVVLPNIIIGDDVIVGAGSVVTKSLPAGSKWIGSSQIPE
jgi:sugar O-acyltransferase (sialic acid O-acetyltransferase NeuD family)